MSLPVLLIVASEDDGGMARVAFLLAKHLGAFEVDVRVVVHREAPFTEWLQSAGVPFDVVPELVETPTRPLRDGRTGVAAIAGNLRALPAAVRAVRDLAQRHESRILYSHNTWSHYVCAFAARAMSHEHRARTRHSARGTRHPARTVHEAPGTRHAAPSTRHEAPGTVPPSSLWHIHNDHSRLMTRFVDRAAIRHGHVAGVIAVSKSIGRPFEDVHVPLTIVHNGIERRLRAASETNLLRAQLGLDDRAVVVAYTGRLVAHKGIHILLAAARAAVPQVPELHVVILGGTPLHARDDVLGGLRAQVASWGMDDRIHLPGYVTDVERWTADADVAVVPSTCADGCPLAAIEALCLGVPVVGSAIGGLPEIVENGVSGVLVPPGDAGALAGAIVSLARQPARLRQLAAGAREQARDRFDAMQMTARVAGALRTAAGPG